ncbi:DUF2285 domain-containing protein [Sphingomonas koreensis]|nr:DUF2285 domain-containing protein [Sphingomonas koreensis]
MSPVVAGVRQTIVPQRSPPIGGCTFALDPVLDCARVVPLWTGAMDPFVLDLRGDADGCLLDLSHVSHRMVRTDSHTHLLLELAAGTIQLGLLGAEDDRAAVWIRPTIDLSRPIEPQFHSTRRLAALLDGAPEPVPREAKLTRLVAALRVVDALADGAGQREIGLGIFGDDWPGDGEHLKSRVRRMILSANALALTGPRAVLAGRA